MIQGSFVKWSNIHTHFCSPRSAGHIFTDFHRLILIST